MSQRLTESELLAFAGLVRILFRLDRVFTEAERETLVKVSRDLLPQEDGAPGPYRELPVVEAVPLEVTADAIWAVIERAAKELPDEESVQESARAVTNPASRRVIFDAIEAIAASDAIAGGEWSMLEWLENEWEISR